MLPRRPVHRTRFMTAREEALANTAQAIREQSEEQDDPDGTRKKDRLVPPEGTAPSGAEAMHS
jgi:hypothetical protein